MLHRIVVLQSGYRIVRNRIVELSGTGYPVPDNRIVKMTTALLTHHDDNIKNENSYLYFVKGWEFGVKIGCTLRCDCDCHSLLRVVYDGQKFSK